MHLCECGCGQRVTKPENRFILGHNNRGVPHSPEHCAAISAALKGVPKSPEYRSVMRNSDAIKANVDAMRGGDDIVYHHTLYDHFDLTLNRVAITRSNHAMGHNVLRMLGIDIPHINVKVVRIW